MNVYIKNMFTVNTYYIIRDYIWKEKSKKEILL